MSSATRRFLCATARASVTADLKSPAGREPRQAGKATRTGCENRPGVPDWPRFLVSWFRNQPATRGRVHHRFRATGFRGIAGVRPDRAGRGWSDSDRLRPTSLSRRAPIATAGWMNGAFGVLALHEREDRRWWMVRTSPPSPLRSECMPSRAPAGRGGRRGAAGDEPPPADRARVRFVLHRRP